MSGYLEVNHVTKDFRLHAAQSHQNSLRELFTWDRWTASGRRGKRAASTFRALDDISFQVEPGKALGIVGHNGSGKSTLLKLLTRIMAPTSGYIYSRGRVGALIEVGAGFHPDLTGRENAYLNGSILGLTRREVAARFDAIVEFAGLAKFIDTPVKRYSSGMYMRLGFSICAHLDPDILLIDEVLAVGDAYFQNKCLRRMKEYLAQGGTVVFVSHAMGQVADLCPQCLWLDHGKAVYHGKTEEAISRYLALVAEREQEELRESLPEEWAAQEEERQLRALQQQEADAFQRRDRSRPYVYDAVITDANGRRCERFMVGEPMRLRIDYRFGGVRRNPVLAFQIHRTDGLYMYGSSNHDHRLSLEDVPAEGQITLCLPSLNLNEGEYRIRLFLSSDPANNDFGVYPVDGSNKKLEFTMIGGQFAQGCAYLPVSWPPEARSMKVGMETSSESPIGQLLEVGRE